MRVTRTLLTDKVWKAPEPTFSSLLFAVVSLWIFIMLNFFWRRLLLIFDVEKVTSTFSHWSGKFRDFSLIYAFISIKQFRHLVDVESEAIDDVPEEIGPQLPPQLLLASLPSSSHSAKDFERRSIKELTQEEENRMFMRIFWLFLAAVLTYSFKSKEETRLSFIIYFANLLVQSIRAIGMVLLILICIALLWIVHKTSESCLAFPVVLRRYALCRTLVFRGGKYDSFLSLHFRISFSFFLLIARNGWCIWIWN